MRKLLITILNTLLPLLVMGQSISGKQPDWVDGYFRELPNSYIEVVSASGYDLKSARDKAANEAIRRRSLATGTEATVSSRGDGLNVESDHNLIVKARILDEYVVHTAGGYTVYLLVQTAKNPTFDYETVSVTEKYPFSARAFVPGMAQIYKGSTGKGVAFITGEIAMLGGVVAFECLRAHYDTKINTTHNADARQDYIRNAQLMSGLRDGFIAGAVAVYVWNVIDGIVAKGNRHVMIGQSSLAVSPYMTPESGGVLLSLKF